MKRNVAIALLIAVILLFSSFALVAETNTVYASLEVHHYSDQIALSAPLVLGISSQPNTSLNQTTRAEIYSYVQANPGVHFRGICEGLGLSVGMVQYHIGVLISVGFLSVYKDGKMQRFF